MACIQSEGCLTSRCSGADHVAHSAFLKSSRPPPDLDVSTQMNLSIIRGFISDQKYVDNVLRGKFKTQQNITGPIWAKQFAILQQAYDKEPFAKKFYMHGFGIEYEDENVYIDYDYGTNVSLGGFDEWRIYMYITKGDPIKWDSTKALQKSIGVWFKDLVANKIISYQHPLYYLAC